MSWFQLNSGETEQRGKKFGKGSEEMERNVKLWRMHSFPQDTLLVLRIAGEQLAPEAQIMQWKRPFSCHPNKNTDCKTPQKTLGLCIPDWTTQMKYYSVTFSQPHLLSGILSPICSPCLSMTFMKIQRIQMLINTCPYEVIWTLQKSFLEGMATQLFEFYTIHQQCYALHNHKILQPKESPKSKLNK